MRFFYVFGFLLFQGFLFSQTAKIRFEFVDEYSNPIGEKLHVLLYDSKEKIILDTFVESAFEKKFDLKKKSSVRISVVFDATSFYSTCNSFVTLDPRYFSPEEKIRISFSEAYYESQLHYYRKLNEIDDSLYPPELDKVLTLPTNSTDAHFPSEKGTIQQFVNDNVHYPQLSIEYAEQGKVYVQFIVEKDGTVTHVRILKGVSNALDAEAIRLVRSFPKFVPSTGDGKPVRAKMYLPVNFTFN